MALGETPERVLGLRVEGSKLSDKDKDDLFRVVQSKLREYPDLILVKPPESELTDEMMELECIDIDVDCITKLGKKYGASRVFYAEVVPSGDAFTLKVRIVDSDKGVALRDREARVAAQAELAGALEREIVAVFGPPPPPKPVVGKLVVTAEAGSKIFIDGAYAGAGEIRLEKPPGTYAVRVTREGYEDELFQLQVEAGATAERQVTMRALPPVVQGELPREVPETEPAAKKPFYKTWWFWTLTGVVVVGATAGAVAAASGGGDSPATGKIVLSVDRANAWRDAAIQARGR
ncbi:MAG: PEGA domain-containing protein [Deltaproteobacteria bacterium]|nr:PEGA domain-containing protein [Deltaproteobacteria bacterium]